MDVDYKEQIKKDEDRIAAYVTLANGKDIELIRLNKELDKANKLIAELAPLAERAKYLERRARPVILIENSLFGRALKKLLRLFRHKSSNKEPA